MEKWQDRNWEPSEEESLLIGLLKSGDAGQALLRKVDETQLVMAAQCLAPPPEESEYAAMQKVNHYRGAYQALQLVKDWLLAERDPETESQEHDDE